MKKFSIRTPDERKARTSNRNDKATDKSILFRFNLFISNPIVLTVLYFLILAISFLLVNYLFNSIISFFGSFKYLIKGTFDFSSVFSLKNAVKFNLNPPFYIIASIILTIADAVLITKIRISYRDFNVSQKGGERFAADEEKREQYKAVPINGGKWQSERGGVIISRDGDNFLVDEEPGHTLIVGTTRSGKGEMFVRPMIELLSRCSCKPSMIVTDPKLELTKYDYNALKGRGYEVYVLNLINAELGDCYNPFSRMVDLYKNGEIEKAYQEGRAFAYSIFCSEQNNKNREDGDIWNDTSTALLSALAIGNIEDCLKLDEQERAEAEYDFKCKQIAFSNLDEEKQKKLIDDYDNGQFDIKYAKAVPPQCKFEFEPKHEKEINMFSIFNNFRLLAENVDENGVTALDKYFTSRPLMNRARMFYSSVKISGYRTKTSIYTSMSSKLDAYTYDSIARMTSRSSFNVKDIGFGDKPIAVFIAVPDYDESNHFFITTFIRQVYYILSSECSKTATGKCKRPVWHILDEFANAPPLDNIKQMVSVGAGLNMFYNFIIQDYAQLDEKYSPEIAKIIRNNCQNQIFIKSNEYDTAEQFSKLLGKETITTLDRIGRRFAIDKTYTERKEEKPLLDANELMNLLEGECVVKRVMKRKTLDGKDATPYPIFNTGKNRMPYAHTYLPNEFNKKEEWSTVHTNFPEKVSLESFTFDIVHYYSIYVSSIDEIKKQIMSMPHYREFLLMLLEDGIYQSIHILKHKQISEMSIILSKDKSLSDTRKKEYREFLTNEINEIKYTYREIRFS
ncbi:MAG: type IV secretory system conjugative DNA transfer family protein [Eubacterium sp.]